MLLAASSLWVIAAPAPDLLSNGNFEDGLRGWEISCALDRCGEVRTESHGGSHAAALHAVAEEWTSVQLRQRLKSLQTHTPLLLEGSIRAGPYSWRAPLEAKIALSFEDEVTGAPLGSCEARRNELGDAWEKLRLHCAPPPAARSSSSRRVAVWAVISFACVRSTASLLVDSMAVSEAVEGSATAAAGNSGAPALVAALPPTAVPKVLHFIFGLSSDFGGKPFGLVHHLVIRAALRSVQPELAMFHHAHEPSGEWWEKTKQLVHLRKVKSPTAIHGHPLRRFAHQADVLRLELLLQFGGVYMDMDVLLLQPVQSLLTQAASAPGGVLLAHEGIDGTIGAGNALMACTRNASIMQTWYGRYRDFSDAVWNGFSVRLPMELAIAQPGAIALLDYTAVYWPPWNPWGVAQLYRTPRCMLPQSVGVHLWETKMWASLLSRLTPEMVNQRDTCFARLAAAVLDGSFDFRSAILDESMPAETADVVIVQTDLAALLESAPAGEVLPLPPTLSRFRGGSLAGGSGCENLDARCKGWAAQGMCETNAAFMQPHCRSACDIC